MNMTGVFAGAFITRYPGKSMDSCNTVGQTVVIILMVTLPFIITGILFVVSHYVTIRHVAGEQQP